MEPDAISIELKRKALWEKFDAFRMAFNEKCELNKISRQNQNREADEYTYNQIQDAWESMESTLDEIAKFQKDHRSS